tara:strand:- start:168 stop:737 length:570 start_codon:yes stop_codon:yes gene_type:complete
MKQFLFGLIIIFFFVEHSLSSEIISGIEDNWNKIKSMSGEFEQIDSDGKVSNGNFFFLKPFLSKFQYENSNEDIITNKSLMMIVDKEGFQLESYSIGNSILKKLLTNDIKIENEFDIISISNKNESHQLLLKVKNDISENQIQFTFDQISLDLEKWEIYDEFGNKTVFKFTKTKKNIFISTNLFLVRYN